MIDTGTDIRRRTRFSALSRTLAVIIVSSHSLTLRSLCRICASCQTANRLPVLHHGHQDDAFTVLKGRNSLSLQVKTCTCATILLHRRSRHLTPPKTKFHNYYRNGKTNTSNRCRFSSVSQFRCHTEVVLTLLPLDKQDRYPVLLLIRTIGEMMSHPYKIVYCPRWMTRTLETTPSVHLMNA